MDLLSHALVGGLVASAGLQKKYGLTASVTMVAANLMPDADGALTVLGPRAFFQYHRTVWTHSLGGAVLLSAALTSLVTAFTPFKRPALVFAISLSGMALHLFSDLLTPWPIPLLWPFSARTYSLDLIHFLDPFLLVVLGTGFLAARRWPERGTLVVGLTLLVIAGYLGFRAYGRQTALDLVRDKAATSRIAALPHGTSPVAWDVIVQEGGDYTCYVVDTLQGEVRSSQVIRSASDERATAVSSKSALVQAFLRRARFPVTFVTEEGEGTAIEWRDVHLMIGGGAIRGVKVVLDGRGEIIEERFELSARD